MKKYYVSVILKRIGIVVLFLSLNILLLAQSDPLQQEDKEWTDTIKELKYELDTTTQGVQPADTIKEEEYAAELNSENKDEREYFLLKEFTGGLPDTLKFRRLPDNTIRALREDKAFWYANETFKKKEKKKDASFTAQPFFQTVLWFIIIGGFITFLILYLYNSNAALFRKSSIIADEEIDGAETSDIFNINYQKEIDKAVGMNNYRLAVRLMFLRLLRNLSDRNIIHYKQDSTNFDYMIQLRSTKLYHDFFRLARNYEYSWYGQFEIDKEKYSIIKNEFENFERKLK